MPVKAKSTVIVSVVLILIAHLFILYFIKYNNQNLSFFNLDFSVTGNVINLFFSFFLLTGVVIYAIRNKKNPDFKPAIIYTIILSLLLLLCFLTLYIRIPSSSFYIFEQPLNKFIVGFLFALYQFIQFMFISFVWLSIFTERDFIFLRVIFDSVIIVILLLLAAYFYIEIKMKNYSENWKLNGKQNVAVVLGAAVWSKNQPSPTLASRVDKAAKLYKKGIVNKIQLTGSNAPGELTEAEVALNYLLNNDVDTSDIFIENETTSTNEQIRFVKNYLVASKRFDNIYIISDHYHLVRVSEISRFYNLKVILAASELELNFDNMLYNRFRECIALAIFWCFAL
jgi:vancomycin permeability regulator SanA